MGTLLQFNRGGRRGWGGGGGGGDGRPTSCVPGAISINQKQELIDPQNAMIKSKLGIGLRQ